MNKEDIKAFSQIPQPPHESMAFIDDLKNRCPITLPKEPDVPRARRRTA